ncbi:ABC transporter ATP-binding protein [Pelagibius sp. CAU 1746]|uniref:ABC transporter ATP-binding protein n=1 Tax=Pelagibius sp. CAU 1746 TaxID=3140370 RepID=UPI00325B00A9
MSPLLEVRNLVTRLRSETANVTAVDNVALSVEPGESVALVGESGCGKSMTALSLMRLLPPIAEIDPKSSIRLNETELVNLPPDRMKSVRGSQMAMIFQDPMTFLNPVMRIGDQIVEAIAAHGTKNHADCALLALEALRRVKIPAPDVVLRYYPHQLSGGMRQRVLIAIAISCNPALLIADEPTTALDVTIQAQVMDLLSELRRELNSALLLITHDLGLVAEYAERVYVMYAGQIVEEAPVDELFQDPKHPYTRALLRSSLSIEHKVEAFETIEGNPPNLSALPGGCRFRPRCREAVDRCHRDSPDLLELSGLRKGRCFLLEERS